MTQYFAIVLHVPTPNTTMSTETVNTYDQMDSTITVCPEMQSIEVCAEMMQHVAKRVRAKIEDPLTSIRKPMFKMKNRSINISQICSVETYNKFDPVAETYTKTPVNRSGFALQELLKTENDAQMAANAAVYQQYADDYTRMVADGAPNIETNGLYKSLNADGTQRYVFDYSAQQMARHIVMTINRFRFSVDKLRTDLDHHVHLHAFEKLVDDYESKLGNKPNMAKYYSYALSILRNVAREFRKSFVNHNKIVKMRKLKQYAAAVAAKVPTVSPESVAEEPDMDAETLAVLNQV